ncbi:MAG: AEC family transporter, partial [Clostridiaceae bacterium]
RFTAVFSNCGFMGYPIVSSIYGDIGVFYAAIFNITFNILIWTYGLALFTGENEYKNIKKVIYNPGIIAVILGLIMFMFSIKIPSNLFNALDLVGSTTIPLSMLIIGSSLSKMKFKDMVNGKDVYYSSFVRLILLPLIVLFVMKLLNLSDLVIGIAVIITAMPAAANTTVFAEKFGKNASFASKCVLISTVLSAITIPLILLIL